MPGPASGREQTFSILTGGQLASAVLHLPAGGGPHPAVLCLHGLAGVKSFYIVLARRLAEAGVACLRLDFRGCGDSAGSLEDLTLETQTEDAAMAFKALRGRPDIRYDGIGLLGFSMHFPWHYEIEVRSLDGKTTFPRREPPAWSHPAIIGSGE